MNFLLKKAKEEVGELTKKQEQDIEDLYRDHKIKKTNLHSSIKVIIKQLKIGLEDIYDRHYKIKNLISPRDSSSLISFTTKYGEYHGKKMFDEKVKKSTINFEHFQKKYGSEAEQKYKEYCVKKGHSLDGYIARYGKEMGPIKHKEFWDNTNFSSKLETFVKRYGEDEGRKRHNEMRDKISFANTLEGYIEKYGEDEGRIEYNISRSKRSLSQSKETMVNNMLKEGKSFDEIELAIEDRWSRSLQTYQRKYGDEQGKIIYEDTIISRKKANPLCIEYYKERNIDEEVAFDLITELQAQRNSKNKFFSKESLRTLLPIIYEIESKIGEKCMFGDNEFFIRTSKDEFSVSNKRLFFYDFTFKEMRVIIEYHGERFHEDIDYDHTESMKFEDFFQECKIDHFKKWVAEQRGFDVFVIRSWNKKNDIRELYNNLKQKGIEVCQTKFF